ncbi:hypothetical protein [Nocardia abscessus]|uniref:hypothetical protein n=1 Tax=Nocardia abscessus TaxID=120957 RepID=UPI002454F693|nr:hypothetical protein [Nocardia abscessus]
MAVETVAVIVAQALAAGAVAGLGETAKQAVADAYQHLKGLVTSRYGQVDVVALEQRPASEHRRQELAEDLQRAGADGMLNCWRQPRRSSRWSAPMRRRLERQLV